ncbi:hypothetical protein D8674_008544 [Pyrus ussuriensis x Pyrus communis]|uniref:Uncharacterized protein n=1 Tax=Pyrus ussuriensis x Pyrus communis TaxID=2448454 RepID=A0A5N5HT30_9ROSA|nr:hypothetical protein D8674_008544 [Pyrus ussuriensis x Pyrus communis]
MLLGCHGWIIAGWGVFFFGGGGGGGGGVSKVLHPYMLRLKLKDANWTVIFVGFCGKPFGKVGATSHHGFLTLVIDLMMELVDTYKIRLPKFTEKLSRQKAKFDIMNLNTIKVASSCFVPALFGHAIDDDSIVQIRDKNIIKFEGDHNSPRPQFYFDSINIFFTMFCNPRRMRLWKHFLTLYKRPLGSWRSVHTADYDHGCSTAATGFLFGYLFLTQFSRRPMSPMEVPSGISSTDGQSESKITFEFANGSPCGPHVPTTMDDDRYMFMEAVMLSLKDLEMRGPQAEEQPPWDTPDSLNLLQKDDQPDDASLQETQSTSTSVGHLGSLKTESISTSVSKSHDSRPEDQTHSDLSAKTTATVTVVKNPASNVMDGLIRRWDFNFSRNNHNR